MDLLIRILLTILFAAVNAGLIFFAVHLLMKTKHIMVKKEPLRYPIAISLIVAAILLVFSYIPFAFFWFVTLPIMSLIFYLLIGYYYDTTQRDAILITFAWLVQYAIVIGVVALIFKYLLL